MAFIDIEIKGTRKQIEQATLLIEQALHIHRTDDVPSPYQADHVTRYITFDCEQTLPMKPVAKDAKR